MQNDPLIVAKRPDQVSIKNDTCLLIDFDVLSNPRVKIKESKKIDKYLDFAGELKKNMEREGDSGTKSNLCIWDCLKRVKRKF